MKQIKVGIISLGCDKNRVDCENMIGFLSQAFSIVTDASEADVVIINTCAFIESATNESIEAVMDIAATAPEAKIIVTGCLPMRYPSIAEQNLMPEVSAYLDNHHYTDIVETVYNVLKGERVIRKNSTLHPVEASKDRVLTTPLHYAYLKIAEGCNNGCAYCAIPGIRGRYVSTPLEELVEEAERLIEQYGTQELILVAQDVTRYNHEGRGLMDLLDALEALPVRTIRLMYCYPEMVTTELLDRIEKSDKIAKYIDIPMQHAADSVLRRMRRRSTHASLVRVLDYIRQNTHIAVRSTFMVGFPGEREEDVDELCAFLRKYRLEYAGFFPFYREEGTPAYEMDGQLPKKVKLSRLKRVETLQSAIMREQAEARIGKDVTVTCDTIDYDRGCFVGHAEFMHPEIDNKVYFTADSPVETGGIYRVHINKVDHLDLVGKAIEEITND
ncbi:MAG: 30S ribosomal protein S12 methylthiotransferase RimO [Clostridia bacterium]|nr:30S ribosomal protein S12 methylthiotransferase RimO [Clostridia bacterium]